MPKGFSNEDKKAIREEILIKGKELFIRYGYKKLGIRDLTSAVGIANGMFYKFFSSKEELFFTILQDEKKEIRNKIFNELLKYQDEPIKALKRFYYAIIEELVSNPLMKTILLKQEYSFISRKMTKEQMLEERTQSLDPILEITEYWKGKGLIKDIDMDLVIHSLRSLVLLWFHKEEIGEDKYDQTIEFMIDRVCDYLK